MQNVVGLAVAATVSTQARAQPQWGEGAGVAGCGSCRWQQSRTRPEIMYSCGAKRRRGARGTGARRLGSDWRCDKQAAHSTHRERKGRHTVGRPCRLSYRPVAALLKAATQLHRSAPIPLQSTLVLDSLRLAVEVLAPKGTFVTKIFRWA